MTLGCLRKEEHLVQSNTELDKIFIHQTPKFFRTHLNQMTMVPTWTTRVTKKFNFLLTNLNPLEGLDFSHQCV